MPLRALIDPRSHASRPLAGKVVRCALVIALALDAGARTASAQPTTPTPPAAPALQLTRADLEAWLDGVVPYGLQQGDLAGLVISVVRNGEVLVERGYGWADLAARVPMDPARSVVHVASLSKSFTATAVMQLVEQGKLDLDRDVNTYLDFKIPDAFGAPITLKHLLTHSAGFEETPYKRYRPPLSLRDHLLMVPDRIYPPGTITAYSNYGLNLAGYIVQRVSGETISEYIERHILSPLGMERSTFHMTLPQPLRALEAKNYPTASSGEPVPPDLIPEMAPTEFPAAALATTAHDMTRFMLAHLQGGAVGGARVLRAETVERMHANAFVPIPGAQPVALGLFRNDYRGHRVIGHSGDGEGEHAVMQLLPDDSVGVFIAINSDGAVSGGIFPAAFSLRAALFERFVDRYFPRASPPQEPTAPAAAEHARLVAGEYIWSRREAGDYREGLAMIPRWLAIKPIIRANDDGTIETPAFLTFAASGQPQRWREVAPFAWREVGGDARLVAKVQDGRVESIWSDATPAFTVDIPVPTLQSAQLNVPLFLLSALALLTTVLLWPVAALVRRRHGLTLPREGTEWRAYRLTRLAALVGVIYLLGWMVALAGDFASWTGATPWIRLIQLMGVMCVVGAGISLWNVFATWRSARSGWAKVWSVVLALALLDLVWYSFAFHLISARMA